MTRAAWLLAVLLLGPLPAMAAPGERKACPAGAIRIGTEQSLFAAVEEAAPGASFCIAAGLHRLQFAAPKDGQRFFGEPGAILSGAKLLDGFRPDGRFWAASADISIGVTRGVCAPGYEACARPVGVFIDDEPQRQVARKELLRPGAFFYDRPKQEIVLAEPPGGRRVEVTAVPYAFYSTASSVLISGLTVEKYANPAQEGAIRGDGEAWRVENAELRLNSGAGVSVDADGVIVNCNIHHNGQIGATADGVDILLEGNEIWANNISGFEPGWDAGGVKITVATEVTFRNNHVHHNNGPGLWCDERCANVVFEDNLVEFNQGAGIFFELSSQAVIRRNTLRQNNQAGAGWYWGAEIQIAASELADITGNTIVVRPSGRAVMLIDQNRWKVGGGFYKTRGNRVHGNDVTFLGAGATGGVSVSDPSAENFAIMAKGANAFEGNTYRAPAGQVPVFAWDTVQGDFAGFRALGQEQHGTLIMPEAAR
ncbi:right-handed parallel beta-helix repeat-containing protein [Bosea caraganae]|uniref:Right-handed parallel beta-helix repeat-containing protein n=1 Tax=Bosea caraganae TaxID=2763117 RepID=A0A370L555_9HYPH|nr:right-handed parallel beta-helix repeat-containing protein [Bosea caraganae]RDJ24069.1 right-handed parallel beta-helix repeat-containing protein [Bosea caraganae]RDJ30111.1 right-handed parallel beta-helix repeat-containing protein [Bosea caraganae]